MSAFKLFFLIFICVAGLRSSAAAQSAAAAALNKGEIRRDGFDTDFIKGKRAMEAQAKSSSGRSFARRAPTKKPLTKTEQATIKAILAPDAEDAAKYKNFLNQKNTGLFRLFPNLGCESSNAARAESDCKTLVSGSWSYSFRREDYSDIDFPDVQFEDGNLISKGFLAQGILVRLGDIPLEAVTPRSDGVKFLLGFAPANQIGAAKKQFVQISKGVAGDGGYRYSNSVRAEENTTYVLRAIAYRAAVDTQGLPNFVAPHVFNLIYLNDIDKREDLTVAFRVVRRDENGGITILWKELTRQNSPKIVFSKRDPLTDIK